MSVSYNSHPYGLLSFTSPSAKMTRGPSGTARFQAHNLYLNSAAPANQSITVVSGATYSVTITGSVSVTASGAAAGTWTAGTQTFTAATGTLTFASTSGTGTVHVRRTPSDATYLETAGVARYALPFDWALGGALNGIRVEKAATNLCLQSQDMSTTWTNFQTTETVNTAAGPDGVTAMDKLIASALAGFHTLQQVISGTTNSATYTFSKFFKAAEYSRVQIAMYESPTGTRGAGITFDLSNSATSGSFAAGGATFVANGIENWGGGLYRCWIAVTLGGADTAIRVITTMDNGTTQSFTGDGTSGIHCGYAQLETGEYPTSYIQTFAATVARAGDVVSLLLSAIPFGATATTIYIEYMLERAQTVGSVRALTLSDGTTSEEITSYITGSNQSQGYAADGGVVQAAMSVAAVAAGTVRKTAMALALNDFAFCQNGGTVVTDVSGTLPTVDRMHIGATGIPGGQLSGLIREVACIPRRMSNAELQALTT